MAEQSRGARRRRQEALRRKKLTAYSGVLAVLVVCLVIAVGMTLKVQRAEAEELNGKVNQTNSVPAAATVLKTEQTTDPEKAVSVEQVGKGLTLVLDPGHGATDPGCGDEKEDIWEKDVNLAIARKVKALLEEAGYTVIFTREEEEEYINIWDRAAFANAKGADLFLSIHQNSDGAEDGNGTVEGIETWYNSQKDKTSIELAKMVQKEVIAATGAKNLKIKEDNYYVVIKDTTMPACLVECGFLTHKEERQRLVDDAYQQKIAEGIAKGVAEFTKKYLAK